MMGHHIALIITQFNHAISRASPSVSLEFIRGIAHVHARVECHAIFARLTFDNIAHDILEYGEHVGHFARRCCGAHDSGNMRKSHAGARIPQIHWWSRTCELSRVLWCRLYNIYLSLDYAVRYPFQKQPTQWKI